MAWYVRTPAAYYPAPEPRIRSGREEEEDYRHRIGKERGMARTLFIVSLAAIVIGFCWIVAQMPEWGPTFVIVGLFALAMLLAARDILVGYWQHDAVDKITESKKPKPIRDEMPRKPVTHDTLTPVKADNRVVQRGL